MTFSKVSMLVPTRKRLGYLRRMLESYDRTVRNDAQAEIVFRCDSDDRASIEFLCDRPFKVLIGPRQQGYKSLPKFFNEMAKVAEGDLLMCCNDDVIFDTPGWPAILLAEAEKYSDGIFNFGVNVGLNDDKFPFSIVSRRLHDILGFINDERLLFSDVFLLDVAKAFDRAIRLTNVSISHDWAGHGHDETRADANRHEFSMVFKDATGAWTDNYAALHEKVVGEAVDKIRAKTDLWIDMLMNSMSSYQPPSDGNGIWPPQVRCEGWHGQRAPHCIGYSRAEIAEVLKAMAGNSVAGGTVILTRHTNGLPNIFWGQLFDRVISIHHGHEGRSPIRDGKYEIHFGSVGDTKFMYRIIDSLSNLRAVILDDVRYSHLISPYFLLRRQIDRAGIVVFINTRGQGDGFDGPRRFLADLQRGYLDNSSHQIVFADGDPEGPGTAYEFVGRESVGA